MASRLRARWHVMVFVAAVVAAGVALRAWIIASRFGDLNGDDAFAGLQSLAVLRDHRLPVVIDGNVYTAAIDAILFSPIVVFAGGSVAFLKWLYTGMWALAALATLGATRRVRDRRAAGVAAALVWLAPGALLVVSTRAYMGYALGMGVVACTVWSAAIVADQQQVSVRSSATLGALAGLAFYVHPMFATAALPVVAVAAVVHRRDWRRWWLPAAAGAIVVNLPFIGWNAVNDWPSLRTRNSPPGTYSERLRGFITELLPRALGLRTFDGEWVFTAPLAIAVYAAIVAVVVFGCVTLVRAHQRPSRWIVPVGLVACLPLMALAPHLIFVDDGRYAIIPFPLMAIAAGSALSTILAAWSPRRAIVAVSATLAVWVAITGLPFLDRQRVAIDDNPNKWHEQVIARLDELGINRLAGNYWLVMPIEYRSDRHIRIAIAGNPYKIRFVESQRIVQATPPEQVAFLFPPVEPDPSWLYLPIDAYRREALGSVILYVPLAAGT